MVGGGLGKTKKVGTVHKQPAYKGLYWPAWPLVRQGASTRVVGQDGDNGRMGISGEVRQAPVMVGVLALCGWE